MKTSAEIYSALEEKQERGRRVPILYQFQRQRERERGECH